MTHRYDEDEEEQYKPRIFATPAYLREIEPGVYQMYRDARLERKDRATGRITSRTIRAELPIGGPMREAKEGDHVLINTVHPKTGRQIKLTRMTG